MSPYQIAFHVLLGVIGLCISGYFLAIKLKEPGSGLIAAIGIFTLASNVAFITALPAAEKVNQIEQNTADQQVMVRAYAEYNGNKPIISLYASSSMMESSEAWNETWPKIFTVEHRCTASSTSETEVTIICNKPE